MSFNGDIHKYHYIRSIGKGTYGEVGLYSYQGQTYAIKRVSMRTAINTLIETSMYVVLSHPHIMKPYEFIPENGGNTIHIVMPNLPESLTAIIRTNRPESESNIALYAWQILTALDYMHSNNIIHRDLKPDNILMDHTDLKIIDFGLAKYMYPDQGNLHSLVQSPIYRAPEVYNLEQYNEKIDIWSVGIIIYRLFSGKDPFYGMSERTIGQYMKRNIKSIHTDIDLMKISSNAKTLLHGLLAIDPKNRLSARDALKNPMFSSYEYQEPDHIHFKQLSLDQNRLSLGRAAIINNTGLDPDKCPMTDPILNHASRIWALAKTNDPSIVGENVPIEDISEMLRICTQISMYEYLEENTSCMLNITNDKEGSLAYRLLEALHHNIIVLP